MKCGPEKTRLTRPFQPLSLRAVNTFDRHLLREWLQILFLVLAALLGLIMVQICYDELRGMLEAGAHLNDVLTYIGVALPQYAALVLPLALLISLLYTLGKLHRANELTAMRAAGVGFGRMMLPVWFIGMAACAAVYWLNSTVVPWSIVRSDQVRDALDYRKQAKTLTADKVGAVYDVAFDAPKAGRMWFFNRFSEATGHGYGVSVTETHGTTFPSRQIWATEAWPVAEGWEFRHGRVLVFDPDTGENKATTPFERKVVPEFHDDAKLMLLTDQRPRDLSIFELHRMMQYFAVQNPEKVVPYAVRYYSIIADTLGPLIVIAIAIPFAVTGVRVNPAVGVAKSLVLFFLYYILVAVGSTLATKGWLEPEFAAWVPNGVMAGLGMLLFFRIR